MKKWIAALCAVVIIAGAVIGIIANNGNQRVDALNKDLADRQTEIDSLLRQTEADAETIKDLNVQVEQAKETIDGLTAENGRLSGEIEQLNTNLSSSQQKLQQIITIITGEAENGLLRLTIRDNGNGFSDESLQRLHSAFAEMEKAPTSFTSEGGEHLGLINTYLRLLNASKGRIRMTLHNDNGAVITLTLPLEQERSHV